MITVEFLGDTPERMIGYWYGVIGEELEDHIQDITLRMDVLKGIVIDVSPTKDLTVEDLERFIEADRHSHWIRGVEVTE